MAKYTSDASLIKGAARAYKDYSNDPAIYAGLNKAITQGGKMFEDQMEKRRLVEKKFDDASEGVLMRSGALGDTLYGAATDDVTKLRDMYIKGVSSRDDKMKMKAMSGLQNLSTFVQDHKKTNLDIAKLRSDGDLSSYYEKSGVGKEEANFITQILDQSYSKVSTNKDGEKVFHVEDLKGNKVMVSNKEYKEMASVIKNYETGNGYEKTLDRLKRQEIWNQDGFSQGIKQVLARNKKQWKATAYDDISGTTLTKMLGREDLDQEIINTIDPDAWDDNTDGILDSEEKANFIDAIMNVDNKFFKLEVSNKILEDELTRKGKESHGEYWTEENKRKQEVLNRSQGKDGLYHDTSYGSISRVRASDFVNKVKSGEKTILDLRSHDKVTFVWDLQPDGRYMALNKIDGKTTEIFRTKQDMLKLNGIDAFYPDAYKEIGQSTAKKNMPDADNDGKSDFIVPIDYKTYVPEIEGDGTKKTPYSEVPKDRSKYEVGGYYINVPGTDGTRHQWNGKNMIPKPLKK